MKALNLLLIDDNLVGASSVWYSPTERNDALGQHDQIAIQADIGSVSGTLPSLTVQVENSADGQNWLPLIAGAPEISTTISPNASYYGMAGGYVPPFLGLVRLKVTLGGTQPACALKLSATCRRY